MHKGFWANLQKPIIGLAPMDGVTDAAFRYITDTYGKPDILFTEFTSVEGICYGASKLLDAFMYHQTETPTVAQIFGTTPDFFYNVAIIIAEMGFDGIDINMGCPDPNISKKGGGAGLICRPQLAQEIVKATWQGSLDWANGKSLDDIKLTNQVREYIEAFKEAQEIYPERKILPVSVKTRTGVEEIVTEKWISNLLEVKPVNITLHGRTLKQLYSGLANWDEIAKAANLAHQTETTLLGNGDIKSFNEIGERVEKYGVDGVLIGRGAFGNPWLFSNTSADTSTKFKTAIEHAQAFEDLTPTAHFHKMRKHLAWYTKGIDFATDLRLRLMRVNTAQEVKDILEEQLPE